MRWRWTELCLSVGVGPGQIRVGALVRPRVCVGEAWSHQQAESCTQAPLGPPRASPYLASREVRWSAVVGSGLMGGEVTKAAAFAQFLLQ